jgi:hypothetical protein
LKQQEQHEIADGLYTNTVRDFSEFLNNWGPIQELNRGKNESR